MVAPHRLHISERLLGRALVTLAVAALGLPAMQAQTSPELKATIARAAQLLEAGDVDGAERDATAAHRRYPKSGPLELQLGEIAIAHGDAMTAERWFTKSIADGMGGDATPMLALARLYLEHPKQFADAEGHARSLYQRALRLDPGSSEANAELSLLAYRHAEYPTAVAHLRLLHGNAAETPFVEALRCGASAALHTAEAGGACSTLRQNTRVTEPDALLAVSGLRAGQRADLIVTLLLAVQARQPLSAAGLRWLGLAQDAQGEHDTARATLEQAYQQAPHDASLLVNLATVAQGQHKPQEALGYLAHARELQPRDAHVQAMFAQECAQLGLLGEARNAMQGALTIEPDNPDYNLTMGKVTALSQDPLSARPFLLKYHSLRPNDPHGTLLLGLIEYRAKEFELARPWLAEAAKNSATAAEANLYLGSGERQLGNLDEASTFLQRSEAINGSDPETHAELGMLALERHEMVPAEKELDRAVALDHDNYTANYGLLQLYAQTKDPRRPEQLRRFEEIKAQTEELNRQAMRVVEIRRDGEHGTAAPSSSPADAGPS